MSKASPQPSIGAAEPPDLVFRNAVVLDGSGGPPCPADVAVSGSRIVHVGPPGSAPAAREECHLEGLALAPGFIDAHTHDDRIVLDARTWRRR
jgi:N-acyl-D-amino-acid deacylase